MDTQSEKVAKQCWEHWLWIWQSVSHGHEASLRVTHNSSLSPSLAVPKRMLKLMTLSGFGLLDCASAKDAHPNNKRNTTPFRPISTSPIHCSRPVRIRVSLNRMVVALKSAAQSRLSPDREGLMNMAYGQFSWWTRNLGRCPRLRWVWPAAKFYRQGLPNLAQG